MHHATPKGGPVSRRSRLRSPPASAFEFEAQGDFLPLHLPPEPDFVPWPLAFRGHSGGRCATAAATHPSSFSHRYREQALDTEMQLTSYDNGDYSYSRSGSEGHGRDGDLGETVLPETEQSPYSLDDQLRALASHGHQYPCPSGPRRDLDRAPASSGGARNARANYRAARDLPPAGGLANSGPSRAAGARQRPMPTQLGDSSPTIQETSGDGVTLVARNIPARYTQDRLLQEWTPDGSFNFLSLPRNRETGRTVGYAFINFSSGHTAISFRDRWQHRYLSDPGRSRRLDVRLARIQGLQANIRHFLRGSEQGQLDSTGLPAIFDSDGASVDATAILMRFSQNPVFQQPAQSDSDAQALEVWQRHGSL